MDNPAVFPFHGEKIRVRFNLALGGGDLDFP